MTPSHRPMGEEPVPGRMLTEEKDVLKAEVPADVSYGLHGDPSLPCLHCLNAQEMEGHGTRPGRTWGLRLSSSRRPGSPCLRPSASLTGGLQAMAQRLCF